MKIGHLPLPCPLKFVSYKTGLCEAVKILTVLHYLREKGRLGETKTRAENTSLTGVSNTPEKTLLILRPTCTLSFSSLHLGDTVPFLWYKGKSPREVNTGRKHDYSVDLLPTNSSNSLSVLRCQKA